MSEHFDHPAKPNVYIHNSEGLLHNKFLIYTLILLAGFFMGFLSFSITPFGKSTITSSQVVNSASTMPNQPFITENNSPISISLLTNPIIDSWVGNVKGTLIQKDEHTFTLKNSVGNTITITDIPPHGTIFKTRFISKVSDTKEDILTLKDIPVGSVLQGSFFIFKDGSNTPVGSVFTKE